jgi:sterol desaturase/sphingolipid hydroxylase (fatty acid hydroxylase superfamily)
VNQIIHELLQLPPFTLNVIRLALWLFALSIVFVTAERLWWLRTQKITRQGLLNDLFYYFLNSLLPNIVLAFPLALIAAVVHRLLPWPVQQFVVSLPDWVRLITIFFVGQVGFYWGHRWTHEIPLLWRFHAVHHSAEELDWLVNTRAHPIDMVFTRLCGFVPIYALGLAQPTGRAIDVASVVVALAGTFWGFFIHANLRWRLGPLEWVFATPAFHHWHHTNDSMRDRNYAAMLPWLDRLFGTYHMPRREWPAAYGIDKPVSLSLLGQLFDPMLPDPKPKAAPKSEATQVL